MKRLLLISITITFISFLSVFFPAEAGANLLPQMITVQNSSFDIIGYINTDGSVMDYNFNLVGFIRAEGRIEGQNGFSIGYFDGHRFTDSNMYNVAYFDGGRIENSNFYPVAHVGFGTIEGQDYSIIGYFMGDTGGQDWIIAAFCIYYTDLFRSNRQEESPEPEEAEEPEEPEEVALAGGGKYKVLGKIELYNGKEITVELLSSIAPETCLRFITLSEEDFYDNLEFFSVKEGVYARAGCPNNDGTGKSPYGDLSLEESDDVSLRDGGLILMYQGESGKDEPNCQFLLTMSPLRELKTSKYTIFGKIIDGMDVLHTLKDGEKIKTIKIVEERNSNQ